MDVARILRKNPDVGGTLDDQGGDSQFFKVGPTLAPRGFQARHRQPIREIARPTYGRHCLVRDGRIAAEAHWRGAIRRIDVAIDRPEIGPTPVQGEEPVWNARGV